MNAPPYIRLTPRELVHGLPLDRRASGDPAADTPASGPFRDPRRALEQAMSTAFSRGRAFVSFSGGRDSSAVLALAADFARRNGRVTPVPLILRYPGHADADETGWQTLVLDHLGLSNEIVFERERPQTYLDDEAKRSLRARGLLWPAALHLDHDVFEAARDGVLLTGEGGDEVLGARRITPLTLLLRERRRPGRALLRWALQSLEPHWAARRRTLKELAGIPMGEWLADGTLRDVAAQRTARRAPLHWGEETRQIITGAVPGLLTHNLAVLCAEFGVDARHPLLDEGFLRAWAESGGRWGFAGRTDAMRRLFSDLLPEPILSRSTKAHFGSSRWGESEREFARRWDGTGLPAAIDPERIRAHWLSDHPNGTSALALHAAWLRSEGLDEEGDPL